MPCGILALWRLFFHSMGPKHSIFSFKHFFLSREKCESCITFSAKEKYWMLLFEKLHNFKSPSSSLCILFLMLFLILGTLLLYITCLLQHKEIVTLLVNKGVDVRLRIRLTFSQINLFFNFVTLRTFYLLKSRWHI